MPPAESGTHNPEHIPAPPAPGEPLQQRSGCGGRGPSSAPRQPCGPTLSPLLRTCQGHVSTLPNSEFLIMPNMVSPRRSGHTSGLRSARVAGESGATRRVGAGGAEGAGRAGRRERGGRDSSGSHPRNALGRRAQEGRAGRGQGGAALSGLPAPGGPLGTGLGTCGPPHASPPELNLTSSRGAVGFRQQ